MMRCDDCQSLLLDHLYGLLDGPEAAALDAHLRGCAACAAACAEAGRVQGLFAAAAKSTFPHVAFEAPSAAPHKAPSILAFPTPARSEPKPAPRPSRFAAVTGWTVAAAMLLAIPGTAIPLLGLLTRAETARKEADAARNEVQTAAAAVAQAETAANEPRASALQRLAVAKQAHDNLLALWLDEEKKAVELQLARKLTVDVRKPTAVQPGAPNEFLLVVRDRGQANPGTRILAEVRDQTDAVIYSQPLDFERRGPEHALRLPAEAWTRLTPQSELFLSVAAVDDKTGAKTELQDKVRLLGPVYATVLTTDKPTYRPGEQVRFRSLTLDRITFRPPVREQQFQYELRGGKTNSLVGSPLTGGTDLVRVADGKVEPILGPDGKPIRGVGTGAITLPADLADGDYVLTMTELPHPAGYSVALPSAVTRAITVRSGAVDSYRKQTGYTAASFAPGDVVNGWVELTFQDKPVAGARVQAVAVADDMVLNTVEVMTGQTGADGRANLRFTLPAQLPRGDVRLKATFQTKTGEETVADRVPVVGRNLIVEFFPEGGTLIAGVPCRVYVRATTPAGQPVDVRGVVTDGKQVLARVATLTDPTQPGANRGLGAFTYVPRLGTPVWLKLDAPAAVSAPLLDGPLAVVPASIAGAPAVIAARTGFALPKPAVEGVVMTIHEKDTVTVPGQAIRVHLNSVGKRRNLVVGAYVRGRLSDTQKVAVEPGQLAEVKVMAGTDPRGGVVRLTVFEDPNANPDDAQEDIRPVAERLVFRKPGELLNLTFSANTADNTGRANGFTAGTAVDLNVAATDETGKPTAAILWATAVNSGVATGAKDRLLPTHFLLAGEINTPDAMEHADFLLTDHPKAAEVLDLVLATQGWRRFAEQVPPSFAKTPTAANLDCVRLLVSNGQVPVWAPTTAVRDDGKRYEAYWPRYEAAVKTLAEAKAAAVAATATAAPNETIRTLRGEAARVRTEAHARADLAAAATTPVERFRHAGWYAIGAMGLLALMLGTMALTKPAGRLPFGVGTIGAIGLAAFLVLALGMADRQLAWAQASGEGIPAPIQRVEPPAMPVDLTPTPLPFAVTKDSKADVLQQGTAGGGGFGGGDGFGSMAVAGNGNDKRALPVPPRGPAETQAIGGTDVPKNGGTQLPATPTVAQPALAPGAVDSAISKTDVPTPAPPGMVQMSAVNPAVGGPPMAAGIPAQWKSVADGRKVVPDDELAKNRYLYREEKTQRNAAKVAGRALHEGDQVVAEARKYVVDRAAEMTKQMDAGLAQRLRGALAGKGGPATLVGPAAPVAMLPQLELDAVAFKRIRSAVPTVPPLVVREYAAPRPVPSEADADGDTILWQPVIVVPGDGRAKLAFHLGSAPGGYQVIVAGHTLDGRIGAVRGTIAVAPAGPSAPVPAPKP